MQAIKIFHLIDYYLPPSQIWLYNLLINTKDVQHHIGTRTFLSNNFYHPDFHFTKSKIGAYRRHLMTTDKGVFRNRLEQLLLWPQKWVYPTEQKQWTKYVKDHGIQIIHAHFANHACEHIEWIKRTGLPFVVSFYGYDYEKIPFTKPKFVKKYKQLFKCADRILCEGPHGVQTLIKMGCPLSKLKIVPLGIDMKEWRNMTFRIKKKASLKLLQIADFTEKKGQIDTIKTAIEVKKKASKLKLTLVGSARNEAYFNKCMQLIQQDQNSSWIKYIPFVSYQKIKELIYNHDIFIHPSKYGKDMDCEGGAPTILFNVQAMGMPVISTNHCDIPFIVKDKTSGLLSTEGDIKVLYRNINYFYNISETAFQQWQKQTYKWSKISTDIRKSTSILLTVYNELSAL